MNITHLRAGQPKASKEHQCVWCLTTIGVGEVHESWTNAEDGTVYTTRCHQGCFDHLNDTIEHRYGDPYFCGDQGRHERGKRCTHNDAPAPAGERAP